MSLSCRISYNRGVATVTNADGTPSKLYQDALELTSNQDQALNIWAESYTDEFITEVKFNKDNATLDEVLQYLDTKASNGKKLTQEQRADVVSFMDRNNISSLSELYSNMTKIFKPEGILGFNGAAALKSGLYTQEDIQEIDIESVRALLENIEGELRLSDIQVMSESGKPPRHIISGRKTVFGTSERVTDEQIEQELIDSVEDLTSTTEIEKAVEQLPYQGFVDKFENNKSFKESILARLAQFRRIPILRFLQGKLTDKNISTYTTVKNTILSGLDSTSLSADITFLENISEEVWEQNEVAVMKVLQEIEAEQIDNNIDIIGLSKQSNNREGVLNTLRALKGMVDSTTEETVQSFSTAKDTLIPPVKDGFVTKVNPAYEGLTIVRLDSEVTDNELFKENGLIKVGDNLYHKVDRGSLTPTYEFLYQEVLAGRLKLPHQFRSTEDITDPENKLRTIKDITNFVNSRDTGLITEFQEEISANQLAFNHQPIPPSSNAREVADIKTNVEYLKTEFVSDFYNYVLQEKLKDSTIYKEIF